MNPHRTAAWAAALFATAVLAGTILLLRPREAPSGPLRIVVAVAGQKLHLLEGERTVKTYPVSTSRTGVGSRAGSNRTPLGLHRVAQKIGAGAAENTIFRERVSTGRVAALNLEPVPSKEDFVTSRILWLEGLEAGRNRGPGVDSFRRYIYIHGTADEGLIGRPASHGCIRMKNRDVIDLFDRVPAGTPVEIVEEAPQLQSEAGGGKL